MRHKRIRISVLLLLFLFTLVAHEELAAATTWSANVYRLTDYPYFDAFPSITQTSDGKIWIVWSRDIVANYTLFYKTSPNLGANWSTAKNLTTELGPGHHIAPCIIESANHTIWVVWSSNQPPPTPPPPPPENFYMNATPTSLTIPPGETDNSTITITSVNDFNSPVRLMVFEEPLGVTTTLDPTEITPPPNGTATSNMTVSVEATAAPGNHIITVTGTSGKLVHSVDVELEIPGSEALIRTSSDSPSSEGNYEIYCKTSTDYGNTWSDQTQLTVHSADDLSPSIIEAANGTFWLVWCGARAGSYEILGKTSSDFGATWSEETPLTTDSGADKSPSITQMKDGRIWVTWYSDRFGNPELFYNIYDGASWSGDTRLTFTLDLDTNPSILQTLDGTIWVFWTRSGTGPNDTGDIYYQYSSDNGDIWSDAFQFTTDKNEDMWPSLAQSTDTKIWIVWTSNRGDQPDGNWDLYYRTSLAGDVNDDGVVDILDLATVGLAFGTRPGDLLWNPDADINKDDIVNIFDLSIVGRYYGST